jgi:hypothetical protein
MENRKEPQSITLIGRGKKMRKLRVYGLGLALALAPWAGAQAQSRGRIVARPMHVTGAATSRPIRMPTSRGTLQLIDTGLVVSSNTNFVPLDTVGTFPVPGLGFDFAHLAALQRNVRVSDISVLSTAERLTLLQRFTRVVPIAFPFLSAPAPVIIIQQPPVVLLQQPPAPEPGAAPAERVRYAEPTETTQPQALPELGEFVLLRRDGGVVFAVAFSIAGDRLTYVTREGVRRSFPLAELDFDATRRMNEERGTFIHLPG